MSTYPKVRDFGITVLHEPAQREEIVADIVFVHGLQGHPEKTWTWSRSAQPQPSSSSKFTLFNTTGQSSIFWPYDLLREDCKNVRILTFGYESAVSNFFGGAASKSHVFSHSRDLLAGLRFERYDCPDRQLIFVAHSLGGIIVKELCLRASESKEEEEKSIFECTRSILFLGTPHRGGNFAELGETIRRIVSASGFDTARQNLETLSVSSGILENIQERFLVLCNRGDLKIYTFQEAMGMKATSLGGLNGKVVDDVSSSLTGSEPRLSINANHTTMCKYKDKDDDGYRKVFNELRSVCRQIERKQKERAEELAQKQSTTDPSFNTEMLDKLLFPEMNSRRREIQSTRGNACLWILKNEKYQKWIREDHGLLWIQGKPGSGKSTIMKRILQVLEDGKSGHVHLSFFFHKRGTSLQQTFIGMLRATLHQLLNTVPSAGRYFAKLYEEKRRSSRITVPEWEWQEAELREVFDQSLILVSKTHSITIFLDALDEVGDDPARAIVSYIHDIIDQLQSQNKTRICFSCRYYPILITNEGIQIRVEDENREDIHNFVTAKLERSIIPMGGSDLVVRQAESKVKQLQEAISRQADGVFLWAILIVQRTVKQYQRGISLDQITERMKKTPSELHEIYEEILMKEDYLENEDPATRRSQALHLLQWILFTKLPLTVTELRFALASDDLYNDESQYYTCERRGLVESDLQMEAMILDLSGGLAEVQVYKGKNDKNDSLRKVNVVQLIHQSVEDFLLQSGLQLLGQIPQADVVANVHERLCRSCINYLVSEEAMRYEVRGRIMTYDLDEASQRMICGGEHLPFLGYSILAWPQHASMADRYGADQGYIMEKFRLPDSKFFEKWLMLYTMWEEGQMPMGRFSTMLHLAAGFDILSIVTHLLAVEGNINVKDSDRMTPLHYAAREGRQRTVKALLSQNASTTEENADHQTPLSLAICHNKYGVVAILISAPRKMDLTLSLHTALDKCYLEVAQLLLNHGADLHKESPEYSNSLHAAAMGDYILHRKTNAALDFILKKGVSVNTEDIVYGSILQYTATCYFWGEDAFQCWTSMFKFLLKKGADINSPVGQHGNPLQAMMHCAIFENYDYEPQFISILEFLLQSGADPNAPSVAKGTAFEYLDKLAMEIEEARNEWHYGERKRKLESCTKVLLENATSRGRKTKVMEEDREEHLPVTEAKAANSEENCKSIVPKKRALSV